MRQAKHLLISGRVQGVSYRYAMQQKADGLGLCGWCRNLSDGRVEALAVGSPDALEQLMVWSWQGPPHASVEHVEIQHAEIPAEFREHAAGGFEIRR